MSNLSDRIEVTQLNRVRERIAPITLLDEITEVQDHWASTPNSYERQYAIGVQIKTNGWFVDDPAHKISSSSLVMQNCREEIIQAVFGEFRNYFPRISRAIRQRDEGTALYLLSQFEKQMFEV